MRGEANSERNGTEKVSKSKTFFPLPLCVTNGKLLALPLCDSEFFTCIN